MGRFAVAVVLVSAAGWPACALAQAAPLDPAVQSLSDVAFVSGHAPLPRPSGAVITPLAGDPVRLTVGAAVGRWTMPDLAAALGRPMTPPSAAPLSANPGLGLAGTTNSASVGAVLQRELSALGVKDGATRYGGAGRFYLFAAVHGQAVGLNLQAQDGALRRTGWSTDISSALVGDGQVGVGWRKGGFEAAVGYVHRGVHVMNAPIGVSDSYADDMAALSLTFHPHW